MFHDLHIFCIARFDLHNFISHAPRNDLRAATLIVLQPSPNTAASRVKRTISFLFSFFAITQVVSQTSMVEDRVIPRVVRVLRQRLLFDILVHAAM